MSRLRWRPREALPGDGVRWRLRLRGLRRELRIEWRHRPPPAAAGAQVAERPSVVDDDGAGGAH